MLEILLVILAAFIILVFFGAWFLFYKLRKMPVGERINLFKISNQEKIRDLLEILMKTGCPFILEIAVHHLGKERNYYLAVEAKQRARFLKIVKGRLIQSALSESEDYYIFHHDGHFVANCAELNGGDDFVGFDWSQIDFSKVNEVGEGALAQFLFNPASEKTSKKVELRLMASAPSLYQAKEILDSMTASFSGAGVKLTSPKNLQSLIHKINFREA